MDCIVKLKDTGQTAKVKHRMKKVESKQWRKKANTNYFLKDYLFI